VNWSGRVAVVTGAGGFIGSHLCEHLVQLGAETRALVEYNSAGSWGWLDDTSGRSEMRVTLGDVEDIDTMRDAIRGADVVFHLAALIAIPYSYTAPLSYIRTNVTGTANVLIACREAEVPMIVHTSTSEVYGTARSVPIDEAHPLQGQSPYSASKIAADKVAESFHLAYGLPVATLRPFNTYGPRQSARAVVPTIATQLLAGGPVKIGNVAPTRDLTFVADTVEAFVATAGCPDTVGRVVNAGSGREISIGDLAGLLAEIVGCELVLETDDARVRPAGSEVDRLLADVRLADELLGWQARVPLRDGLTTTVDWLARHRDLYRAGDYTV
jgi:NAD dependent epimerase/dehydratase